MAILLLIVSYFLRLGTFARGWPPEYAFVDSLGSSRDTYDLVKLAVLVRAFASTSLTGIHILGVSEHATNAA